jgi:hypothetical protein
VELAAAIGLSIWVVVLHGLFLFHAGPLWRDEVGTIDFALMPTLSGLWDNLRYDNFPPLFAVVARVWMQAVSGGDFSCRVLGFLIGLSTVGVLWFGARRCGAALRCWCWPFTPPIRWRCVWEIRCGPMGLASRWTCWPWR